MMEIRTPKEFENLCRLKEATGVFKASGCTCYLQVRPHGVFLIKERDASASLSFVLKLPKIPETLLLEIIDYFREDIAKEAAVRICFDDKKSEYFFVKAGGYRTGVSVYYDYSDSVERLLREEVFLVMEIHSHNVMSAFWSVVDDADELNVPGALFGVIGRLDRERPQMLCRAVMKGLSGAIDPTDLFDFEDTELNKKEPHEKTGLGKRLVLGLMRMIELIEWRKKKI